MSALTIRIPSSWLGEGPRRRDAFKVRLSESVSGLSRGELLQRWKEGSSLRKQDRRARCSAEKSDLEIMLPDAEYRHLETVGATILRSAEDLLVAMAGELEESFTTWEKVEAAANILPFYSIKLMEGGSR